MYFVVTGISSSLTKHARQGMCLSDVCIMATPQGKVDNGASTNRQVTRNQSPRQVQGPPSAATAVGQAITTCTHSLEYWLDNTQQEICTSLASLADRQTKCLEVPSTKREGGREREKGGEGRREELVSRGTIFLQSFVARTGSMASIN